MLFHSSKKLLDSLLCSTNDWNHLCVWFMQETKFSWKPRQEVCTFSPCSGKSPAVGFHSGEKSPPISSAGDSPPRRSVFYEAAAAAAVVVDVQKLPATSVFWWVWFVGVEKCEFDPCFGGFWSRSDHLEWLRKKNWKNLGIWLWIPPFELDTNCIFCNNRLLGTNCYSTWEEQQEQEMGIKIMNPIKNKHKEFEGNCLCWDLNWQILHRKSSSEKPKSPHMQHSGSDGELAGAAPVDVI